VISDSQGGRSLQRVLFVDDEPYILDGLTDLLRGRYEVVTATSGARALRAIIDSDPFTVIVSDFAMPGMNGAEFLAQARIASPDAIRMLLTGQATLEGAAEAVNQGHIFRFLLKPCSGPDLRQALDDAVEQYRLVTADRQLLEHKLETMAGHLVRVERLASLGTMSGAVGHELNNVLTAFGGAMSFIEEDIASGIAPSAQHLAILRQVQQQLTLHASNLLHFGRPSRASGDSTDLKECLNGVLGMLRLGGRLSRVQVTLDLPPTPVVAAISRASAEQMFLNLIKNAIEALDTNPNPRILVRAVCDDETHRVVCNVSDNGSGIPAGELPLLFEPYFTTKPPDRGTGLGLFVVRDAVHKSGGEVAVQSRMGEGTTFSITIPLHDSAHPSEPPAAALFTGNAA
jgi:signal transduction histidine kinase